MAKQLRSGERSPGAPRHPLTKLRPELLSRRVMVFTPSVEQIDRLMDAARRVITGLGPNAVVHKVFQHNPDAFWAIATQTKAGVAKPEGFLATLLLNDRGMLALASGELKTGDPQLEYLTRQHEKPAGIYYWAFYAPGILSSAAALLVERISSPLLKDVDIYGRAVNQHGVRDVTPFSHPVVAGVGG